MDIQQSLTNLAVTGNDNRVGLFFTNYQTNFEEEDTSRILFRDRWKQARGLSEGVARCPNPESTLRAIIKSFRESLATMFTTSSEEFDEPSSMVRDIQDQCQGAEESSRLLRACKKIDGFAHYLKSYFHVVEIFVTGDTDCSLLACSALHLVFSLSSRYVNIFETLADMLSKMTNMLPRYWHYLQRLRGQDLRGINSHFGYALSFLYADILQFCRDACQVLAPKCSAERSNEDNLFELLWAPIDIRFQLMLDRFQDLTELGGPRTSYKNERAPAPGVPEVDKEETIEWLKRGEGLKLFIEKVRKDLDTREEIRVNHEKRCELRKKKEMLYETRLRHIVQWMSPPDFVGGSCESSDYEQARRRRKPHSCAWILHDPTYASWKWRDESSSNILWLEAKPGFGKTTLSVTIIEDLRDAADEISTDMYSPFVAYFHFDLQRPDKRSYSDALRALIVQFIYSSAPDTEFIDAISLFKYPHNGEQQKPSVDNMMEIFLLCASRLPQLSLVLDGVDECEKFGDLLSLLVEACTRNKNLNIIFLGRPSVPLPIRYRNIVTRHSLHDSNRSDIRDYLLDELGELKGSNKLEDGLDLGELADILTLRADSMFLWATLMVSYLGLSAHSPAARTKTIQVTNCLQELDELYRELLKQYGKKTQAERDVLAKILHILIMAEHPPTLQQMKIAIAIIPGRSLSKADFLTNFPDALREICGALVEIRPDNTVQLVHLSLREVLCSEQTAHIDIPFKADSRSASLFLSVISLSYLIHDVPRRHLADSPQTIANTSELNNRFPFLEFAARTWVNHAIIAINSDASTLAELIPTCQPLVQQLLDFVRHSGSISMWIEACWTYGFAPSIVHLWEALDRRRHSPTPVTQRSPVEMEIEPFIERIQSLSQDLNRLHIEWHHLLQIRPYEIWGASISGFMGPLSWARNIDAKLYLIGSEHLHESNTETIIVRSKVSDCGRLIGVVKILRPSNVEPFVVTSQQCTCGSVTCHCAASTESPSLTRATAEYSIYRIRDGRLLIRKSLDLNRQDLQKIEQYASGKNFRFPIAFASNLVQLSILQTIYWLAPDVSPTSQSKGPVAVLFHERIGIHERIYRFEFSNCGSYLAVAKRKEEFDVSARGLWSVTIWKRQTASVIPPSTFMWNMFWKITAIYGNLSSQGTFKFNPCYSLLAVSPTEYMDTDGRTWIYNFQRKSTGEPRKRMVYGSHLRNLHFSPCGRYLFGDHGHYGELRWVSLLDHLKDAEDIRLPGTPRVPESQNIKDRQAELGRDVSRQISARPVSSTNALTLCAPNGVPEFSVVRRYTDGAVVRKRLTANREVDEVLLYLPNNEYANAAIYILDEAEEEMKEVRMVLANEHRDSYTWNNFANAHPPLLVTRTTDSVHEYKLPRCAHEITYEPQELSRIPGALRPQLVASIRELYPSVRDSDLLEHAPATASVVHSNQPTYPPIKESSIVESASGSGKGANQRKDNAKRKGRRRWKSLQLQ